MSNATLDYFEEYRDKIAELYRLNQQLEILEQEQQKKLSNIRVISGEIEGMRKIISIMCNLILSLKFFIIFKKSC